MYYSVIVAMLSLLCSACAQAPSTSPKPVAAEASAAVRPVFGTPPPGSAPAFRGTAAEAPPADGFELRLTRGACYGICPSYRLVIHANGSVDYQGGGHVAVGGVQHGQADPLALARLRAQLSAPDFALWGRYVRGEPACGPWATDMPGVSIQAYVGGSWRRIEHDHGCHNAPAGLTRLEKAIDDAANAGQWSGAGAIR